MLLSDPTSRRWPLHLTRPSPPSGWPEDSHLQTAEHAQHTAKRRAPEPSISASDERSRVGPEYLLMEEIGDQDSRRDDPLRDDENGSTGDISGARRNNSGDRCHGQLGPTRT